MTITYDDKGNCTKCKLPGSGFLLDGVCECASKDDELPIDFNSPETVLIEIAGDEDADQTLPCWKKHSIETCTVIDGAEGIIGAASYEATYGGFLDYTIQDLIDCPGVGWFVVKDVTGTYHKGDGWMTDDDMDFYCGMVRRATQDEIAQA